jgi:lipopolysaccharide/colanic/teichoic acid biosynthesis glycosyltransferase
VQFGINTDYKMLMEIISRLSAIIFLSILAPVYLVVILGCFLFQGFPIFFKQKRVGHNFRFFKIYKFRTMVYNSGNLITDPNDSRITIFGKFLRYTKIDEIPQLINIIKGDMRFIGPRPEVPDYVEQEKFSFLKIVKPGISDFSSIVLRDESKILIKIGGKKPYNELLPIKIELASYYASKKSFVLDLQLLIITTISIFFPNFAAKELALPLIKYKSKNTKVFINKFILK